MILTFTSQDKKDSGYVEKVDNPIFPYVLVFEKQSRNHSSSFVHRSKRVCVAMIKSIVGEGVQINEV